MDRIHRDWMNRAIEVGENSSGACIVDETYKILLGEGRAKMPCQGLGIKKEDPKHAKYVCHAEVNAIVNAHKNAKQKKRTNLKGCTLYSTHYPCYNCGPIILQSKIKEVYYDKHCNGNFQHFNEFNDQIEVKPCP